MDTIRNCFLLFSFLTLSIGCQPSLTLLQQNEILDKILNGERDHLFATYLNKDGSPLSKAEKADFNSYKSYRKFYVDDANQVQEVRVLPINHDSQLINEIKINVFQERHPLIKYDGTTVDCGTIQMGKIINSSYEKDQGIRTGKISGDMNTLDDANQMQVIPMIINCGWPDSPKLVEQVFYIFQHSDIGESLYVYDDLKLLADEDKLPDSLFAKFYDRILTRSGLPQLYGTQSSGGQGTRSFHEIKDVLNVNERRKKMGLCPIEQKARAWGFEFNVEDYLEE